MAAKDLFSTGVQRARRFYLESGSTRADLRVVCGGWERCSSDYEVRRDGFPMFGIEYVAGGEGDLTLGGRPYRLSPGTVFSYGPGVAQVIGSDRRRVLDKYFVDFSGRAGERLIADAGLDGGQVRQVAAPERISVIFEDLIVNGLRQTAYSGAICAAILRHLLLALCECAVPFGTLATPGFATYARCRRHLEEHALTVRSLAVAAAQCGVSEAYFCRLFQRFDRQSPYQALTRLRMREAVRRFETPGSRVATVAAAVGYDDPFHFSRVFKRVYGVSPQQFRRVRARSAPVDALD
ncbi:MAG: helix-turn-helix transcriptional regulator [Planctomycetes bacterium]|nr:helix-turn-helix transcriptional regulator [Planctomycetota bacterium]